MKEVIKKEINKAYNRLGDLCLKINPKILDDETFCVIIEDDHNSIFHICYNLEEDFLFALIESETYFLKMNKKI